MIEPHGLRLSCQQLYLSNIGDNFCLDFTDREVTAMWFSKEEAEALANFLESHTCHSFVVEAL